MQIRILTATAIAAAAAAIAAQAGSGASLKTALCGQVKKGPHASYTSLLTGRKLNGNTWTVFATGVPCTAAMRAAPAILRWWAKAKVDAHGTVAGFTCNKEADRHGSSGMTGCLPLHGKPLANIELIMTASATIAQIKQLFGG